LSYGKTVPKASGQCYGNRHQTVTALGMHIGGNFWKDLFKIFVLKFVHWCPVWESVISRNLNPYNGAPCEDQSFMFKDNYRQLTA